MVKVYLSSLHIFTWHCINECSNRRTCSSHMILWPRWVSLVLDTSSTTELFHFSTYNNFCSAEDCCLVYARLGVDVREQTRLACWWLYSSQELNVILVQVLYQQTNGHVIKRICSYTGFPASYMYQHCPLVSFKVTVSICNVLKHCNTSLKFIMLMGRVLL